jgi:3-hydroxyisobutyrate dehydrogenase-like beta-hydroxyacid dehydrogenase
MSAKRPAAFLGLGRMGGAMAKNLLASGRPLTVWNRTPEKTTPFVELGATAAATPAEAAASADFVLYSLADAEAIEAVVFGADGVCQGIRAGSVAIDLATVHPETSRSEARAYAERGVDFLDAPVFGSRPEAEAGGLWIPIGGERQAYDRAREIFEPLAESTHYLGPTGSGATMGLIGSLVVAHQLQALGEGLLLARRAGLALPEVVRLLGLADFSSPLFTVMGESMIRRDFRPVFSLEHLYKDVNQIARLADELAAPVPGLAVAREMIKAAVRAGHGHENASAVIKALESLAGTEIGETL